MIKTKSNVHNCNIVSIDYNLFDFNVDCPSFDEKMEQEFYNYNKLSKCNNEIHMVDRTHYELVKPVCPECGWHLTIKQEYREIKPVLPNIGKTKLFMRRYKCKKMQ